MDKAAFIREFYHVVFNQHNARGAEKYLAQDYIQHNPGIEQGREAFILAFEEKFKKVPQFHLEVVRTIIEGDMAAVHIHAFGVPGQNESVVVDIYRFANDLLAEHWDVLMPIPEKLIGNNNLF